MKALLCSANEHKLAEMRDLLPGLELELLVAEYPPEDGATYLDNARVKARYGRSVGPAGAWMLADDSGIEVAALGGAPGVATARWAQGEHVERLLDALGARRTAVPATSASSSACRRRARRRAGRGSSRARLQT